MGMYLEFWVASNFLGALLALRTTLVGGFKNYGFFFSSKALRSISG